MSTTSTTALINLARLTRLLLTDPAYFWILASLVVLGDAILTQLIIRFVSCQRLFSYVAKITVTNTLYTDTEIDWETYMAHIGIYLKGERDYTFITGPTGPLVCALLSPQFVYSSRRRPVIQQVTSWSFAFCI